MVYQNIKKHPVVFGIAGEKNSGKTYLMKERTAGNIIKPVHMGRRCVLMKDFRL